MLSAWKRVLVSALAITVALGLGACSDPDLRSWVSSGRPIVGGVVDDNPAHMATVAITDSYNSYFCSGTLITDTVVMTAAHCLEDYWGNPVDPTSLDVFFGANAYNGGAGEYRGVSEGVQHPNWNRQTLERDIALLRLSSTAPATITPIPYLPSAIGLTQADEGVTSVDFSGFGLTENNSDGQKLHASNIIDTVCDAANGCDGGNVVQYGMGYDESPGGPCSGDSGGPAYVVRNNVEYVGGITSYGDQNCTYFGVSTMPDRYSSFIDDFIGGGSSEDCTNGVDDDDDNLVDCDDPDCDYHPSCQGPTACADAVPITCGSQTSGTTVGGAYNFVDWSCPEGGVQESGPEVAYKVIALAGQQVTVNMQPGAGGDLDLFAVGGDANDCDQAQCMTVSGESNSSPEQITFTMPATEVYLVVETWDNPTTFDLQVVCGEPEICDNGTDDDGDGQADCDDTDCANHPNCAGTTACSLAQTIGCGDQISADANNGVSSFDSYSCLPGETWAGPELAFYLDIPAGTDVVAEMVHGNVQGGSDLDMFLLPVQNGSCAPDACLDASYEAQPPEQISFTMPAAGAYLVVDTWQNPTSFSVDIACSGMGENCTNGVDDDGDGQTDCEDPDCSNHPSCQPTPEDCANGLDDDGDGQTDCDDSDCVDHPFCENVENCINGTDDDGDGQVDCDDPDCANDPNCQVNPEICDNQQDDDGDGLVDCADADCANDPACQANPEICDNQQDDDGDGFTDCQDPDCANAANCQANPEICDNNIDDDGDGLTDCADPNCFADPDCLPAEDCDNTLDDDGDGLTDCDDTDCANDPACQATEICNNGLDDDGDGQIDCADTDCANDPACQAAENCTNGTDDDGDGLADCDDPDCANAPACQAADEICDNGLDDDNDGDIDCADADCAGAPACQAADEICDNGLDDDGDGQVDCADISDCANDEACMLPGGGGGGCGCAAAGQQGPMGLAGLAIFGLMLFFRRRRS